MKLICETLENTVAGHMVEHTSAGKSYFIEGVFMQSNIKNKNGRFYPRPMMEQEVQRYINENVTTGRAMGELGHPAGPQLNLDRVSHLITELRQQGDDFIGKAKILNTPMGQTVVGLIEGGVNFGVSSRGLGALKQNQQGINEVSNYRIATAADIVADPSAPSAFVRGIMEGAEWVYDLANDSYEVAKTVERIQQSLTNVRPSMMMEELKLAQFERFMSQLSKNSK